MTRVPILILFIGLTLLLAVTPAAGQSRQQPNILVMFSDDQGYADLSCQGVRDDVMTPHIDSLAKNGVRFTAGYVTAPQCGPSRAGLVSGRYQQRFGVEENGNAHVMLMEGGKTIGDQFKAAGYATAHFGKWHLGADEDITKHGFDESYGFADESQDTAKTYSSGTHPSGKHIPDDRNFAAKTIDFIERHKDQPWCVYLAFHAPHGPHTENCEYRAKYRGAAQDRQGLLAAMALLDDAVGMVLKRLEELKLDENTLIFFISDNGGQHYDPEIGKLNRRWLLGSINEPYRGGKGVEMEGGIRVPFLAQWKGVIPAGQTYDRSVISLDVIPTALAAAGAKPIPDYELDGVNLLPFLKAEQTSDPHEALFWRWRREQAIRVGDWKLLRSPTRFGYTKWALIDLGSDIEERKDLSRTHPEIAKNLQEQWDKWNASLPPIATARIGKRR